MKPFSRYILRSLHAKVRATLVNLWRDRRTPQETSVYEETCIGAAIGCGACILMTLNSSPLIVSGAAVLGLGAGAVVGLLRWITSTMLPDERIVPPAAGEERSRPRKSLYTLPSRYGQWNANCRRRGFRHGNGGPTMKSHSKSHRSSVPRLANATGHDNKGTRKGTRQVIEQAERDISRGLRDTDLHGIPSDVPGPAPDPEHSPGAEVPQDDVSKPRKHDEQG